MSLKALLHFWINFNTFKSVENTRCKQYSAGQMSYFGRFQECINKWRHRKCWLCTKPQSFHLLFLQHDGPTVVRQTVKWSNFCHFWAVNGVFDSYTHLYGLLSYLNRHFWKWRCVSFRRCCIWYLLNRNRLK